MKKIIFCIVLLNLLITLTGCRTVYYPVNRRLGQSSCSMYNLDDIKEYLDNNYDKNCTYDEYMHVKYGF